MRIVSIFFLSFMFSVPTIATQSIADKEAIELLDREFKAYAETFPIEMSMWGYHSENKVHLENLGPSSGRFKARFIKGILKRLSKVDRNSMSEPVLTQFNIFTEAFQQRLQLNRDHYLKEYFFNHMSGHQKRMHGLLVNQKIETLADSKAFLKRLKGARKAMKQLVASSRSAYRRGIYPPRITVQRALVGLEFLVKGAPFDDSSENSVIWKSILERVEKSQLSPKQRRHFIRKAELGVKGSYFQGIQALIRHANWLLKRVHTNHGLGQLPGGKSYYSFLVNFYTTTGLSIEEVHEMGRKQVQRIRKEMLDIRDQLGFSGTLRELHDFMRTDEQFFFSNDDAGRNAYLQQAREVIAEAQSRISEIVANAPKGQVKVVAMPPEFATGQGAAWYKPTTGEYMVDVSNMNALTKSELPALAYHEGLPGHHLQNLFIKETKSQPLFRPYLFFYASTEGWGLYAEKLPFEMGLYKSPYQNFGRLNYEMLRALRLVVDTGMHAMGMSFEEAVQYCLSHTGLTETDLRGELERYLSIPGQATSYMVGMQEIVRWRQEASLALGERFDLPEFHEVILRTGFAPLNVVEDRVQNWVEQKSL